MGAGADDPGSFDGDGGTAGRTPPRDLIDFYRRWSEFRDVAVAIAERVDLSAQERDTVRWLILLVDRIGEQDIGPARPQN
ncbi:hypothetical protein BRADO1253 [Bradyrhizobium sp. ORS 278]|nr:hypothetical protein BRADO1253 [Bradyrhizobium sp. ORS 278]